MVWGLQAVCFGAVGRANSETGLHGWMVGAPLWTGKRAQNRREISGLSGVEKKIALVFFEGACFC